ncbi:MAG: hypothetical protein KDD85_05310 [Parvularculaceae bacterium]|nr:hypothetical protein [Parvularculaceae bacterium]
MRLEVMAALSAAFLLAGCATAEQTAARQEADQQRLALVKAQDEAQALEDGEKVSLDASLEEHGKMTLLDDETGEEKLICKYEKMTGSRFGRKVCATPREWEQKRIDSQENVRKTQRNMDARCPGGSQAC